MSLTRVKIQVLDNLGEVYIDQVSTFDAFSNADAMTQAVRHFKKNSKFEILTSNYVLDENKIFAKAKLKGKTFPKWNEEPDPLINIEFSICAKTVVIRSVKQEAVTH